MRRCLAFTVWISIGMGSAMLAEDRVGESAPELDARIVRQIENLRSRAAPVRASAARALIEVGDPALVALEAAAKERPELAATLGDIADEIRWSVSLAPPVGRFEPPTTEVFDVSVLEDLGFGASAKRNPRLIAAILGELRRWEEDAVRPTGVRDPLADDLYSMHQLRAGRDTPFEQVERLAEKIEERWKSPEDLGLVCAAVAHIYGQSGCPPRTLHWAQRALELPLPPDVRLRSYEYLYSASLLRTRNAEEREQAETRRTLLRPSLFALREALAFELPRTAPELPGVGLPEDESEASRRRHRRQVQARVAARLVRDLVSLRDIHRTRVLTHAVRDPAERAELEPLLDDAAVLQALARALRESRDVADGLAIARAARG